jgi:hypothetical protein
MKCVDMLKSIRPRPRRSLVLSDVGCGDQKLAQCLAEQGMRVEYRPYDLLPQSPEVRPLDIETELPQAGSDVISMLGVAEYLSDLPAVFQRLSAETRYLLVSYVVSDYSDYSAEKLDALGWKNHFDRQAFTRILEESGFAVETSVLTANGRTAIWLCRAVASLDDTR